MDNSNTRKEEVGRTHQGVDGYTPIAAYIGVDKAEVAGVFEEQRPGKRVALMKMMVACAWQGNQRDFIMNRPVSSTSWSLPNFVD